MLQNHKVVIRRADKLLVLKEVAVSVRDRDNVLGVKGEMYMFKATCLCLKKGQWFGCKKRQHLDPKMAMSWV